jgi:hypothetical protein
MLSELSIAAGLCAAIAILSAPAGSARAAPACAGVTSTDDALGFRARSNSDRCEGLYVANVSGGGVDLFSLTFGTITFGSAPHPVLVLRLDTEQAEVAETTLFSVGMCDGRRYLMEARGPAVPFFLPTASVIEPADCRPGDIGLYATRPITEAGARDVFIPVHVAIQGQPEPGRSTLEVALLPQTDLHDAYWRVTLQGHPPAAYQRIPSPQIIPASQPLHFAIPAPASAAFALELRYTVVHDGQQRERRFDISTQ